MATVPCRRKGREGVRLQDTYLGVQEITENTKEGLRSTEVAQTDGDLLAGGATTVAVGG